MATCTLNLIFQTTARDDFEHLLYWKKGHGEGVWTVFVVAPASAKLQYVCLPYPRAEPRPYPGQACSCI